MAEEKLNKQKEAELNEEQLDNISGGGSTSPASFLNNTGGFNYQTGTGIGRTNDEIMY